MVHSLHERDAVLALNRHENRFTRAASEHAEALAWLCACFHFHLIKKLLELNEAAVKPTARSTLSLLRIDFGYEHGLMLGLNSSSSRRQQHQARGLLSASYSWCLPRAFVT